MNNDNKENKSYLGYILLILDLFLICGALFVAYGRKPTIYAKADTFSENEVTFTPGWESSNPFLFTYTGKDYNISVMPMVNKRIAVNTIGNKTTPILSNNTLTFTSLYIGESHNQRINYSSTTSRYEDVVLRDLYNLNFYSSNYPNYYGSYFSSKWLYYEQDDYDAINNSSIFNHIRMNIYSNNQSFLLYDFNGNQSDQVQDFDYNIYLMLLTKNEMLYTTSTGSTFTDLYPNNAFGINSDGVIKTNIPFATNDGNYSYFSDFLKNGITIDIYFKEWLGYSQYNNLVGIMTNFYMYDYDGDDPLLYVSTTLDYVPITFNWDDDVYENGFNDGVNSVNTDRYYNDGYNSGYNVGYDTGYNNGLNGVDTENYYDTGYSAGYSYGHDIGYDSGYEDGYTSGLTESSHDYGFFDLLFTIVNAPVNVLMQALSFTVWGVNVWGMIITLLTACIVVWLVRKILGSS